MVLKDPLVLSLCILIFFQFWYFQKIQSGFVFGLLRLPVTLVLCIFRTSYSCDSADKTMIVYCIVYNYRAFNKRPNWATWTMSRLCYGAPFGRDPQPRGETGTLCCCLFLWHNCSCKWLLVKRISLPHVFVHVRHSDMSRVLIYNAGLKWWNIYLNSRFSVWYVRNKNHINRV
jgi:hypothetical protein